MKSFIRLLSCIALIGLILPQAISAKSVEDLNREFDELLQKQNWEYDNTVDEQNAEFLARNKKLDHLFESLRDKVLNIYGNDPAKAKKEVWQGEKAQQGRKEVKLEPALKVEVTNFGQGKVEVTAVSVPEATTDTAKKQAIKQAKDVAGYKLAERIREMVKSQAPNQQIDEKQVTELVEAGLRRAEPVFVTDRTPGKQPLCYVKVEIPIFNSKPNSRQSTVESIIRKEIKKPVLPILPKLEYTRKPVNKGPCTGLIVDAKGKDFVGKPLIRIFSEDNLEDPLYSILFIEKREKGMHDMYDHCTSPEDAKTIARVTANPVILPAKKVQKGADIILSAEDAYALTVANFNDFLSQARVVIVYEGGEDAK